MFEISWSELLILGIVTLIFVGPKELPTFLRTLGRYAGVVKRHVGDVRAQFEVVMRESELDQMRKEVDAVQASVKAEIGGVKKAIGEPVAASARASGMQPRDAAEGEGQGAPGAGGSRHMAMPPMPAPPVGS